MALCAACTPEGCESRATVRAARTGSASKLLQSRPHLCPMQAGLYLVVVTADRKVDMKVLAGKLGLSGTNFRFADEAASPSPSPSPEPEPEPSPEPEP